MTVTLRLCVEHAIGVTTNEGPIGGHALLPLPLLYDDAHVTKGSNSIPAKKTCAGASVWELHLTYGCTVCSKAYAVEPATRGAFGPKVCELADTIVIGRWVRHDNLDNPPLARQSKMSRLI